MHGRVALDDAGEQRPLVHIVKAGGKLQSPRQVFNHFEVGGTDQFHEQFLVVEDEIAEAIGSSFVELIPLQGGEHGPKYFGSENVGETVGAFLG